MHIHKGVNGIDEKNLEFLIIFTVLRFSNKLHIYQIIIYLPIFASYVIYLQWYGFLKLN